ncbi:MAG TPA: BadF/BadG/BcrA/BcrD ATPase family protein [Thermotogota bacterium]|jgi:N-acetylglucosamine kinase-like BadF-type ATPase|nr:hypothetical protein [Thermotogota bacterium]NLH20353.1 hypothetical protein [Thermotogaceae bacterium]HNW46519.1 BadF/BadG/BcrA/BcrD ATPase family protein [Thermotogota bacterium]HNY82179.1 BadF/BadG/BcrA/BcrD ATPase family protein [Thermotogota bacterium]HOD91456.1 BadF/BadG/BcrA/BcrD ATPase family protein [Thermotogota bacterium]
MKTFLAIDAGGSTLRATWMSGDGNLIRKETLEKNANFLSAGEKEIENILRFLKHKVPMVDALTLSMAGIDGKPEFDKVKALCDTIFPTTACRILPDADGAYYANFGIEPGVLVICGTGSIVLGKDEEGKRVRSGGWGYLLGDEGSGFWLVKELFRKYLAYCEFLEERKACFSVFEELFPGNPRDAFVYFYQPETRKRTASFANRFLSLSDPYVIELHQSGLKSLATQVLSVLRRMGLKQGRICLMGGVFSNAQAEDFFRRYLLGKLSALEQEQISIVAGVKNISDAIAQKMVGETTRSLDGGTE